MKDPFTQALDHRYSLARQLKGCDGIPAKDLFLVQAVAFPDISVHKLVLAPDAPAEIVIDRRGLHSSCLVELTLEGKALEVEHSSLGLWATFPREARYF